MEKPKFQPRNSDCSEHRGLPSGTHSRVSPLHKQYLPKALLKKDSIEEGSVRREDLGVRGFGVRYPYNLSYVSTNTTQVYGETKIPTTQL